MGNGIIYGIDIQQDYDSGLVTNVQRWMQHVANGAYVGLTGAAGAGVAALPGAASAPAAVPATIVVVGSFDLTLAQEMTNNRIEGQSWGDAFFNARASTIDTYFFWTDSESVDQWIDNLFN